MRIFGERCGVVADQVNEWVYGRYTPNLKSCVLGAMVLEVTLDEYVQILRDSGLKLPTEPYCDSGPAGRRRKRVRKKPV